MFSKPLSAPSAFHADSHLIFTIILLNRKHNYFHVIYGKLYQTLTCWYSNICIILSMSVGRACDLLITNRIQQKGWNVYDD